ncbi:MULTISPECIES: hypothetical protein [unclassified Pseudofrankia]|uniref:hypothetical protein n=1 Tax=unclassified Pseudofrankia TaxID=2994372 RepID=UPI0008D9E252|nr:MULTISPECIES: hypothetical protein [unclassified Pseudofrankia]MDT3446955.1 hypothetical protein [Pseudofrankia sp. BMG5.37]OHV58658.1 hypothetical protein BCD48_42350 [Pseudofrankia sp. BMG5.36]
MDVLPDILLTVAISLAAGALGALAIRLWERPGGAPMTRPRQSTLFGLAADDEILLAVASLAPNGMIARDDVLAVAEISSIIYGADARPKVAPGGAVQDSIGRRTEFCIGDPRSNPRMAAHLSRYLPGVTFSPPTPPAPPRQAPALATVGASASAATAAATSATSEGAANGAAQDVTNPSGPMIVPARPPRESRVIAVSVPSGREGRRLRGEKGDGADKATREFAGRPGEHEFALLARVAAGPARRPLFILAGQTATANLAAAYYLRSRADELTTEFSNRPSFCLILRVDAATVYGHELVEREADISAAIVPPTF